MSPRTDVLLLAAHALELAPLQAQLETRYAALKVMCHATGVGMAQAGGGAAQGVSRHLPRCALLLGSCGGYPEARADLRLLDVLLPHTLRLADPGVARGQAAFPAPMHSELTLDAALVAGLRSAAPAAKPGWLATSLAITTDDDVAAQLAKATGCDAENLEAHAIAESCQRANVPFAAVLAVTNQVGARGRQQWLAHCHDAARVTAEVALAWLDAGAPGLQPPVP